MVHEIERKSCIRANQSGVLLVELSNSDMDSLDIVHQRRVRGFVTSIKTELENVISRWTERAYQTCNYLQMKGFHQRGGGSIGS